MKKIGIITLTDNFNIGNRLQNYAVQHYLENNFDVVCFTIGNDYGNFGLTNFHVFLNKIKYHIKPLFGILFKRYRNDLIAWNFNRKYIRFSKFSFNKEANFKKIDSSFDFFVIGSDQIWNPYLIQSNSISFGLFTSSEKKMCFAPSIAVDNIPYEKENDYISALKTFKELNVREESGALLVQKLTGLNCISMIDPTLTIQKKEWEKICDKEKELSFSYILVYMLGSINNERLMELKEIAKIYDAEIVYINISNNFSPSKFVSLIKNAAVVCTDSFHGTVFSFIFDKKLIIYERQDKNISMNSRLSSFTQKFYLTKCLRSNTNDFSKIDNNYELGKAILKTENEKVYDYFYSKIVAKDDEQLCKMK